MASVLKQLGVLNLTTAGTEQAFTATPTIAQTVILSTPAGNTGVIYIGDSAVSSTNAALILKAGEIAILPMSNISGGNTDTDLSQWYFDGGTTNDDLCVGYLQRSN